MSTTGQKQRLRHHYHYHFQEMFNFTSTSEADNGIIRPKLKLLNAKKNAEQLKSMDSTDDIMSIDVKCKDNLNLNDKSSLLSQLNSQFDSRSPIIWSDFVDILSPSPQVFSISKNKNENKRRSVISPGTFTTSGGSVLEFFNRTTKIALLTMEYFIILQTNYHIEDYCKVQQIRYIYYEPVRSNEGHIAVEFDEYIEEDDNNHDEIDEIIDIQGENDKIGEEQDTDDEQHSKNFNSIPNTRFHIQGIEEKRKKKKKKRHFLLCCFRKLEFFEYLEHAFKLKDKSDLFSGVPLFEPVNTPTGKYELFPVKDVRKHFQQFYSDMELSPQTPKGSRLSLISTRSPYLGNSPSSFGSRLSIQASPQFILHMNSFQLLLDQEQNPFMIIATSQDKKLFDVDVVGNSSICSWLIRFDDTHVHCCVRVYKRTVKDELIAKLCIVTNLAVYLCSNDKRDQMERRIMLKDIESILVEHRMNVHDEFALIIPSEYDLYLKSSLTDRLVSIIRKQSKKLSLQYGQNIIKKVQLRVTDKYKRKIRSQRDVNNIRNCITKAITENCEEDLQTALEWGRFIGMDNDSIYILGEQELSTCREVKLLRESIKDALTSCNIEELNQFMDYAKQNAMNNLFNEMEREVNQLNSFYSLVVDKIIPKLMKSKGANGVTQKLPTKSSLNNLLSRTSSFNKQRSDLESVKFKVEEVKHYVMTFLERANELYDMNAIQYLVKIPPLLPVDGDITETQQLVSQRGSAMLKNIENQTKITQKTSLNYPSDQLILQIIIRRPCFEEKKPYNVHQMKVVIDIFDSLGYHKKGPEFIVDYRFDTKRDGNEAYVEIPFSSLDIQNHVQSYQTHFVISVEFTEPPLSEKNKNKPINRLCCVRILKIPKEQSNGISETAPVLSTPRVMSTPRDVKLDDAPLTSRGSQLSIMSVGTPRMEASTPRIQRSESLVTVTPNIEKSDCKPVEREVFRLLCPVVIRAKERNILCVLSKVLEFKHAEANVTNKSRQKIYQLKKLSKKSITTSNNVPEEVKQAKAEEQQISEKWMIINIGKKFETNITVDELRVQLGVLPTPQHMIVRVVQGRNLASRDWNGKSDPYVVAEYEHQKFKTKYIRATLNPVWKKEEFAFAIGDRSSKIKMVCWDHDMLGGDDYMGEFFIDLLYVEPGIPTWYKLQENEKYKDQGPVTGDIKIEIEFDFGDVEDFCE